MMALRDWNGGMARVQPLLPYLPARLIEFVARLPVPSPPPPWEEHFEGAVLFVDVSGFTVLSELLARRGPTGAERLTDILNRSYSWMVSSVEQAGGGVARFSGDAFAALFSGWELEEALVRAVHCGLDLLRTAHRQPAEAIGEHDFDLRIKVGVSAGRIYAAALGDRRTELRYVLAGEAMREASFASSLCGPMEMLVPSRLHDLLPDDVTSLPGPERHAKIMTTALRLSTYSTREPGPRPVPLEPEIVPFLRRFVPAPIVERLELGLSSLVAEHRPVTVMFASVGGIDFDSPTDRQQLGPFIEQVFQCVERFGGTVDKIEQADKGTLVMAAFGAPRALERAEEAGLACAYALRSTLGSPGGPHVSRVGLHAGLVFAGDVGAPWRHDYTVMGDVVNVAARLMSAADPGEVRVSARVISRATEWRFGPRQRQQFKGKSEEIEHAPLHGPARQATTEDEEVIELPNRGEVLFGRDAEKLELERVLEDLHRGKGGVVVIEGEVGVGKTRLAAFMAGRAFAFAVVLAQRSRPPVQVPYGVWQGPLTELLGGGGADLERRVLERAQHLGLSFEPWLGLLNPVLGTALPLSTAAAQAGARARERHLQEIILELLRQRSAESRLLILLEDFHEADAASLALLQFLAEHLQVQPVVMVVLVRPGTRLPALETLPGFVRINLLPLERPELEALLQAQVEEPLDPKVLELVWQQSQGNPLFAEELLQSLLEAHKLQRVNGRLTLPEEDLAVPDTLRSVVQSRLDELPEPLRALIKVAAVVGNRFPMALLADLASQGQPERILRERLDALVAARILAPAPEVGTYEFRHVLTREVIYSSLTSPQQLELHRQIGSWLEHHAPGVGPAVLANHAQRGQRYEAAIRYFYAAAEAAAAAFAHEDALHGYSRAYQLAEEHWLPLPDDVRRQDVLEAVGDLHLRLGQSAQAIEQYRLVRTRSPDWLTGARCLRKEAEARLRMGDVDGARRAAGEALLLLKGERPFSGWLVFGVLALRVLQDLIRGPQTTYGPPVAEADRPRVAELDHVYSVLGLTWYFSDRRNLVLVIHRMFEVTQRLREPGRSARCLSAIALMYAQVGQIELAQRFASEAESRLHQVGDDLERVRTRANITWTLLGAAHVLCLEPERAARVFSEGIQASQSVGDRWEEGLAALRLAELTRYFGRPKQAHDRAAQVQRLVERSDQTLYRGDVLLVRALCLGELGRFDEALSLIEEAGELLQRGFEARARLMAVRGWIRFQRGQHRAALSDLREAVRLIGRHGLSGLPVAEVRQWHLEVQATDEGTWVGRIQAWLDAFQAVRSFPALRGAFLLAQANLISRLRLRRLTAWSFSRAVARCRSELRQWEVARGLKRLASLGGKEAAGLEREALRLLQEGSSEPERRT